MSYQQYDYFVWQRCQAGDDIPYPGGAPGNNERGDLAVSQVSWNEVNAYLAWLSGQTGDLYRLPTEAEWEYMARAGTKIPYWWDSRPDLVDKVKANCDGCGSPWDNQTIAPVDSFDANDWGVYNTAGNVWEWTCSLWQTDFSDGHENRCVEATETESQRVLRGGSWNFEADWLRSSARFWNFSDLRSNNVGFRVLLSPRTQ